MDEHTLFSFRDNPDALPLYQKFEECVCSAVEDVEIKTQKTQISFYNRHMFACVSFAKVRKKSMRPDCYIVITFGLDHKVQSPRIDVATEARPNRWTHHVLISELSEIDDELMGWVKEASIPNYIHSHFLSVISLDKHLRAGSGSSPFPASFAAVSAPVP